MVGTFERILRSAGSEQAGVSGEEVFEAKIGDEVAGGGSSVVIVFSALADEFERLGSLRPLQGVDVEGPEVPLGFDDESGIRIDVLCGKSGDFGRTESAGFQVPFRDRRLSGVDGQ